MAKRKSTTPKLGTCWHEAGHAVAALAQGLHVITVSVMAEQDWNGSCVQPSLLMYDARGRKQLARCCIISTYAGIEAERLNDPNASEELSQSDFDHAFEMSREYGVLPRGCGYVGDDVHHAFLDRLRGEARRLVRRHRDEIRRLALALSKRRTLTGEQAKAVVQSTHSDAAD